ncbi:MAG TPA: dTDP-4-dehydrorhamnose reductase [Candidatus Sulfotelmatobacter sp.]|nr:dTDP-4-dehydrorhamnose reductase [Candidatus Sulfotelmatobacter sp.]
MKVMVIGATGLLGKALLREWTGDEIVGLGSRDMDIRDATRVRAITQKSRPDWIVLAAAYTDVDGCEAHPELAFSVNRDGAVNVAAAAEEAGAKLIFLSSDYVFDGSKTSPYDVVDERNAQSVYGRSKAEAEVRLFQALPQVCIVRTSWLFGAGGKCFPDTILTLAANRPFLDVVDDQRGCPTYSRDLAKAIISLCRAGASGILHVTNSGHCSWFEFAREIVGEAGLAVEVRPVSSAQMARPAPRPAYSVLSATSLHPYAIEMPEWKDALRRYLQERASPAEPEIASPEAGC